MPPPGREAEPLEVLEAIRQTPSLSGQKVSGSLIIGKMKAAATLGPFPAAVAALKPDQRTLERIAAAVIRLYVATGDFTALHAVTATHAYRQLLPFVQQPTEGVRYLWQAIAAAYITMKTPVVTTPASRTPPTWETITSKAAASRDPHDLKLVDIARHEESCYHDPIYRLAAARRMKVADRR
jgi:Questin oxidase-like